MTNFVNRSFVRYSINLSDKAHFRISSIFASFHASRALLKSNPNWLRQDLSPIGLIYLIMYVLVNPCILPHLNVGFGGLNVQVPTFVIRLIRNFVPLTRGFESYSTAGGFIHFQDLILHLKEVIAELQAQLDSGDYSTFGYQVPGLSDPACYKAQILRVIHVLGIYSNCSSPQQLVIEMLVTLSSLRNIVSAEFSFEDVSNLKADAISFDTSSFGARKYIRFGNRLSFVGDPSQFSLCVHLLFIGTTSAHFDSTLTVDVTSPMIGSNIVILDTLSQGDWLISFFNSVVSSAQPKDLVQNKLTTERKRAGFRGMGSQDEGKSLVNQGTRKGNKREYSTSAGSGSLATDPVSSLKLFSFSKDHGFVFEGYLIEKRS